MKLDNVYFITGTAYAGKSTLVKNLAAQRGGIACGENYHDALVSGLDSRTFPCLTYTRDLTDWRAFIRRTPGEYAAWVEGCNRECAVLEQEILARLSQQGRPVFVDTNIPLDTLHAISDPAHVLVMLADPAISVSRFFDRPDREKQFLYRLLMQEPDPALAMDNFRACLRRINSPEQYDRFLHAGFPVILRDETRSPAQTVRLAEELWGLPPSALAASAPRPGE